jgi:hypothetical protein
MVSKQDALAVFSRTFSRPFRLLFRNPVCALFSVYYAYIYGASARDPLFIAMPRADPTALIYIFLVSVPLGFASEPFSRPGLYSHHWSLSKVSLAYLGLSESRTTSPRR